MRIADNSFYISGVLLGALILLLAASPGSMEGTYGILVSSGQHRLGDSTEPHRYMLPDACLVDVWPMKSGTSPERDHPSSGYLLEIIFETDSDWSNATMNGIGSVAITEYDILEGEEAPDLSIPAASPLLIQVNKKQYDMSPVKLRITAIVLDPVDEVELVIRKGHIGKTEVTLRIWKDGQFAFFGKYMHVGVNEAEPEENPARFRISTSALSEAAIDLELESPFCDVDKLVLAFHYPWYATPYGPSGRWFHWEGTVKEGWIDTSTHFPLFGAYDSSDEHMIEAQMLLAQHAGIDGFISSWWGPDTFEDQAFPKILKVAETLNFKVSPYYESYRPWGTLLDPVVVADELAYLVDEYSNSGGFLKIGETPVIFIYAVQAQDREPEFWIEVRTILEGKVGRVFLVGDLRNPAYVSVFDGFHVYAELDLNMAKSIYEMFSEQMNIGADALDLSEALEEIETTGKLVLRRKLTCGTVTPGYDDRKIRSPGTLLDRMNGGTYQEYWGAVQESCVDWALITSWNEWHEGTEVEPSLEYGVQYLTETRASASQFKDREILDHGGEPDLLRSVKLYGNSGALDTLEVTLLNTGNGPAVATRVEIDLGDFNANVLGSSPYPHQDDHTVNYVPLIHAGDSAKVVVLLTQIPEEAITVNQLSIRYLSSNGELKISEQQAIRLEKRTAGDESPAEPTQASCLIATAAYGTPTAKEMEILREFRDEYLLTSALGRALVDVYYGVSPPIAEVITEHPSLKSIVRAGLAPAVVISTVAVNTTPGQKIAIMGLLVLVSATVAVWATKRRGGRPEYS